MIIPFTAGENAAASDALDTVSLMIVKGIADNVQTEPAGFKVLTDENAQSADFVIEGTIDKFSQKRSIRKIVPSKHTILSISAKLKNAKTNETVLIYSNSISSRSSAINAQELAYQLGQELGLYLLQTQTNR